MATPGMPREQKQGTWSVVEREDGRFAVVVIRHDGRGYITTEYAVMDTFGSAVALSIITSRAGS